MEIEFTSDAIRDLNYWKQTNNNKILERIRNLVSSMLETPFQGIGKPEALKYNLSGKWSRRITDEHRLIYSVTNTIIYIHSLKGHY